MRTGAAYAARDSFQPKKAGQKFAPGCPMRLFVSRSLGSSTRSPSTAHDSKVPMPFELGLVVAWAKGRHPRHRWFVFEAVQFRLGKSPSDLNGTAAQIHNAKADEVLRALSNVMYRKNRDPELAVLRQLNRQLALVARAIKRPAGSESSLFESMAFRKLVTAATELGRARFRT
jgi:hypothetical protein